MSIKPLRKQKILDCINNQKSNRGKKYQRFFCDFFGIKSRFSLSYSSANFWKYDSASSSSELPDATAAVTVSCALRALKSGV